MTTENDYRIKALEKARAAAFEQDLLFKYYSEGESQLPIEKEEKKEIKYLRDEVQNEIVIDDYSVKIPKDSNIVPISDVFSTEGKEVIETESSDKIEALTNAFFDCGVLIKTEKSSEMNLDISVQKTDKFNKSIIIVSEGSKLRLLKRLSANPSEMKRYYENFDIYIKRDASLDLKMISQINENVLMNSNINIYNEGDVSITNIMSGGKLARSRVNVFLSKGSKLTIKDASFHSGQEIEDKYINVVHRDSNSESRIDLYSILNKNSKGIIKGMVRIKPNSSGSKTELNEKAVIIGNARVNLIPALEVGTNDVIASHSDSSETIDKDKLFYLESKGLNEREAKLMILTGFVDKAISDEEVKEDAVKMIDSILA